MDALSRKRRAVRGSRYGRWESPKAACHMRRVIRVAAGMFAPTLLLAVVILAAVPGRVLGFIVPAGPGVDAGSEWRYNSNLGKTVVRMLRREAIAPGVERYTWEMRVAGLKYEEDLELTAEWLGVGSRTFSGLGLLVEEFRFEPPELVMELPLEVGRSWSWSGSVDVENRRGAAHAKGEVVRVEEITVPAGTFWTYYIRLERTDEFGTRQYIDLWFNPDIGPIRARGDLRWPGLVGVVQDLIGLRRFEVELVSYEIKRVPEEGTASE